MFPHGLQIRRREIDAHRFLGSVAGELSRLLADDWGEGGRVGVVLVESQNHFGEFGRVGLLELRVVVAVPFGEAFRDEVGDLVHVVDGGHHLHEDQVRGGHGLLDACLGAEHELGLVEIESHKEHLYYEVIGG